MNCIVGKMRGTDQELRINYQSLTTHQVQLRQWIHVMHQQTMVDLMTGNAQITALVTCDDGFSSQLPLSGPIELLIHPPIETEGLLAHIAFEVEILEAFLKRLNASQLRVASSFHHSRCSISRRIKLIVHPTKARGSHRALSALSSKTCATLPIRLLPMACLELFIGNRGETRVPTHGFECVDIQLFDTLLPLELLLLHFHQL